MLLSACLLGALWGIGWAMFLWMSAVGRWLRLRRTWLTVVVGVGMDLLIVRMAVDVAAWLVMVGVVACSGQGVVAMAWGGEYGDHRELMDDGRR